MHSLLPHTTNLSYLIPSWMPEYCATDLNHIYSWMTRPFLFEDWIIATDGVSLIGFKVSVIFSHSTSTYLSIPTDIYFNGLLKSMLTLESSVCDLTIDILRFKSFLTEIKQNCNLCGNTRSATCSICSGSTEKPCNDCNSEGSFPCPTCRKPDRCTTCDGLGVVECTCEQGQTACICTDSNRVIAVKIKYQNYFVTVNLARLEKLLLHLITNCKISFNLSRKLIIFWDETQRWILIGLEQNFFDIEIDLQFKN